MLQSLTATWPVLLHSCSMDGLSLQAFCCHACTDSDHDALPSMSASFQLLASWVGSHCEKWVCWQPASCCAICTQLSSTHLQCFVLSPFWKLQDLLWEIPSKLQQARTRPEDSLSPAWPCNFAILLKIDCCSSDWVLVVPTVVFLSEDHFLLSPLYIHSHSLGCRRFLFQTNGLS